MNAKKQEVRVCECGRKFRTSAKFGNETKCHGCYEFEKAAVVRAFAQFSAAEQEQILAFVADQSAKLDAQQEERRIDATAGELLQGIDL